MNECSECHARGYETSFGGPTGSFMKKRGTCFTCAFWLMFIEENKNDTVIDGIRYEIGDRRRSVKGMAGRRFDIEYFDGRKITTNDLWCQGEIPERFRQRIPDTAHFMNGATAEKVGDILCWNPSKEAK